MPDRAENISERIVKLLSEKTMTRQELAAKIGMSKAGLSHLLNGNRKWDFERLYDVARVLGVDVIELLGGEAPAKTVNRVCVEFSPQEIRRVQRLASSELRTVENYVKWIFLRSIPPTDEP